MTKLPRCIASAAIGIITALVPGVAFAAEWYLESTVQLQGVADSNPTLATGNESPIAGGVLTPEVKLGRRTEQLDLSLIGKADFNGYGINSDLSSVDERVGFHGTYQTELSQFGLDSEFNRDTILDNIEDNRGEFTEAVRVTTTSVSPTWSYQATPLDHLDFLSGYTDKAYDSNDLTDYVYYYGSVSWSHLLSETESLTSSLSVARFLPDDLQNTRTNTFAYLVGWSGEVSERFHLDASAGPELDMSTSDDLGGGNDTDNRFGYQADVRAIYLVNDVTKLQGTYSHKSEPTGDAETIERDRVGLSVEYRWSPLVTLHLTGNYVGNESGASSADDFRQFFSIEPGITWRLERDLDLSTIYRYRHQTFRDDNDDAQSNLFLMTLTYRLPRLSWSD